MLDSFISRNNDIGGFWGLGMLYSAAGETGTKEIRIDLLQDRVTGNQLAIEIVRRNYRRFLETRLAAAGLGSDKVKEAEIIVVFESHGDHPAPVFYTRGEPFLVTVSITSDLGRVYKVERVGRCAPHDPKTDHQRLRDYSTWNV